MSAHDLDPAYVALYDQIAATRRDQLANLAALARAHLTLTGCAEAGCAGAAVGDEIARMCRDRNVGAQLLFFAAGELARLGYGTPARRTGGADDAAP